MACHVLSSSGVDSLDNPGPAPSGQMSQDFLFVIKGVQVLCAHGHLGAPYLALLQEYFHINIVRAVRLGNLLYACGAQCVTSATI